MKFINAKVSTLIKIYSIIYWTVYGIKSWINWELRNPFQWMLDVPNDIDLRTHVLMIAFLAIVFGETIPTFSDILTRITLQLTGTKD